MSYYGSPMGDYRTYGYAGDPGFLSSLWRGVKKYALPVLGGIVGGPIGGILGGAVGGAVAKPMPQFPVPAGTIGGAVSMPGGLVVSGAFVPGGGRGGKFGGRGAVAPGQAMLPGGVPVSGVCPSGYHYAKDGSGKLVRNRRMNVANPRALRRSMRRVQGFEKLARRTITFTRRTKMKKARSS